MLFLFFFFFLKKKLIRDVLHTKYEIRLEWLIIVLIIAEVLLELIEIILSNWELLRELFQ